LRSFAAGGLFAITANFRFDKFAGISKGFVIYLISCVVNLAFVSLEHDYYVIVKYRFSSYCVIFPRGLVNCLYYFLRYPVAQRRLDVAASNYQFPGPSGGHHHPGLPPSVLLGICAAAVAQLRILKKDALIGNLFAVGFVGQFPIAFAGHFS
jgi:hypothetical protein